MHNRQCIAVIPARGGSKRIPGKNIKPFAGKPIIAYSIETALACGLFDRVIVSTDDAEIACIARQYGAQTPFIRAAHLADDHCGTVDVINDAIDYFKRQKQSMTYVCCIYATAPFLQAGDLITAYHQLTASDKDFAFSITSYASPVQRALRIDAHNQIACLWPQHRYTRTQDLPATYHDAGQFYFGKYTAFLHRVEIFSAHSIPVILPRHRVHDIDTPEDWQCAENMYRSLQNDNIKRTACAA